MAAGFEDKKHKQNDIVNSEETHFKCSMSHSKEPASQSLDKPVCKSKKPFPSKKEDSSSNVDSKKTNSIMKMPSDEKILQNFLLIWLDKNIDESVDEYADSVKQLKLLVASVVLLATIDECINFIEHVQETKIFLIVSGSLGQKLIPQIHNKVQIDTIYIFCRNPESHKRWSSVWPKVRGIQKELKPILQVLEKELQRCDQDSISISVNGIDPSFMYTQLFKEALLDTQDDDDSKNTMREFVEYCRFLNFNPQQVISFEQAYQRFSPIWWYTAPYFLFSTLNRALRVLDVDIILKMGFFIRHLHQSIQERCRRENLNSAKFIVYRGQGLSRDNFSKIQQAKNKELMSFNSFLSTSTDQSIAEKFTRDASLISNNVGVLFIMTIDPSLCKSTPFTKVAEIGFYKNKEEEILFSTHTIFRIDKIESMDDGKGDLWRIYLSLTNESDDALKTITYRKRKELAGIKGKCRLGQLLILVDQPLKAKQFYEILLKESSNNVDHAYYNHQLGGVYYKMGEYAQAIQLYYTALDINLKAVPINYKHISTAYQSIGAAYHKMKDLREALEYYEKAFKIKESILKPDDPEWISSCNHMGFLFNELKDYPKAIIFFKKALEISQKKLPPYDQKLAHCYHHMGMVHGMMDNYAEAFSFLNEALRIFKRTIPRNHSQFAELYNTMGCICVKRSEYSQSLDYFTKALHIYKVISSSNNLSLATCNANIGMVYLKMENYSTAFDFYEKAHYLYEQKLTSNDPELLEIQHKLESIKKKMDGEKDENDTPYDNKQRPH